jgi:hypothetical protein
VKLRGHSGIEEFNLSAFLLNVSLMKTQSLCCSDHFSEHLLDMRETLLSLNYNYSKTQQNQSWPDMWAA